MGKYSNRFQIFTKIVKDEKKMAISKETRQKLHIDESRYGIWA